MSEIPEPVEIDIFVAGQQLFSQGKINNAQTVIVVKEPERTARFTNAEDTILAKMRWYRLGGEVSEHQWRDIQGIFDVQGERLDQAYLFKWAANLGVSDLLGDALAEYGERP